MYGSIHVLCFYDVFSELTMSDITEHGCSVLALNPNTQQSVLTFICVACCICPVIHKIHTYVHAYVLQSVLLYPLCLSVHMHVCSEDGNICRLRCSVCNIPPKNVNIYLLHVCFMYIVLCLTSVRMYILGAEMFERDFVQC